MGWGESGADLRARSSAVEYPWDDICARGKRGEGRCGKLDDGEWCERGEVWRGMMRGADTVVMRGRICYGKGDQKG